MWVRNYQEMHPNNSMQSCSWLTEGCTYLASPYDSLSKQLKHLMLVIAVGQSYKLHHTPKRNRIPSCRNVCRQPPINPCL